AAGRVSDMNRVFQIEFAHQLCDIGCVGVHLVAGIGLVRATVPASVMGDDAIALVKKEQHLIVPIVCTQRPAVMKHNGLPIFRPPILVEDAGAILGGHCRHVRIPWAVFANLVGDAASPSFFYGSLAMTLISKSNP